MAIWREFHFWIWGQRKTRTTQQAIESDIWLAAYDIPAVVYRNLCISITELRQSYS